MSFRSDYNPEQNVHPESRGCSTFFWDGLVGRLHFGADEFDQPETVVIIRDGEEDSPATVAITGISSELAGSSVKRVIEDLREVMI